MIDGVERSVYVEVGIKLIIGTTNVTPQADNEVNLLLHAAFKTIAMVAAKNL